MVARVQQHVAKRVVDLARRRQKAQMVAIREDLSSTPRDAIHGAGDSARDRFHAAAERTSIACLDDEMGVIALEGVVHEPKARSRACGGEAALDGADDRHGAERGYAGTNAHGHMRGQRSGEVLP